MYRGDIDTRQVQTFLFDERESTIVATAETHCQICARKILLSNEVRRGVRKSTLETVIPNLVFSLQSTLQLLQLFKGLDNGLDDRYLTFVMYEALV